MKATRTNQIQPTASSKTDKTHAETFTFSSQTGYQTPQMEKALKHLFSALQPHQQQLPNGTGGRNLNPQFVLSALYPVGIDLLSRIFEVLPGESANYPDDLPTSFVAVENEIARCISGCLRDVPKRKRDISYIQGLLRVYRVVRIVPGQNPTVSLGRVHTILQDNYKDSCFCKLMNILIVGFMNTEPKVITF